MNTVFNNNTKMQKENEVYKTANKYIDKKTTKKFLVHDAKFIICRLIFTV